MNRARRIALLYRQVTTVADTTARVTTESSAINTSALTIGGGGGANPTEIVDVVTLEETITNAPIIENSVPVNSATPTVIRTIPIPSSAKGKKCLLYGFLQLYTPSQFSTSQTFDYGLQIDDQEIKFGDSGITKFTQTVQNAYSIGSGSTLGTGGITSLQPISLPVEIPTGAKDLKITIRNSSATIVTQATEILGSSTTYGYTGALQTYTVPAGVNKLFIYLWGAGGMGLSSNNAIPGAGAFVSGTYLVSPGQVLHVVVGRQGVQNSAGTIAQGGPGSVAVSAGHGGGFSGIFTSSTLTHATLIACAGGGGSGGYFGNLGGSGGVIKGVDTPANPPATGGTQTEGGNNGGTALQAGPPGASALPDAMGGGGGYYGGGGARQYGTGGAGGSSYTGGFNEVLVTQDGGAFTNSPREPGGTTNQFYISPRGRAIQPGQVTIVQATTRSPARINANIKFVVF